ncbi:MAG: murein L,D-transpeptidase, partial [Rhizorhabdus sp.]
MMSFASRSLLLAALVAAAPSAAQVPVTPETAAPTPIPLVQPQLPLPTLSDAQRQELARLIAKDEVAQGLSRTPRSDLDRLDNASLARVALDHARAVHGGRLMPSDFQKDWGIRPTAYDPLPGFVDA